MQETVNKVLYHSLCNVIWGCETLGLHGEGTRSLKKGLNAGQFLFLLSPWSGTPPRAPVLTARWGASRKQRWSDSPGALLTHRGACSPQGDYDISLRLPHRPQAIPEKGELSA